MGNYYSVCQNELFLELKQELIETEAKEISERMDSILAEMKRIIFRKKIYNLKPHHIQINTEK